MTTRIVTDANGRKHITNEPLLHPPQRSFDYKEHAEGLQRDYDLLLAEYNDLKAQRTWVGLTDEELAEFSDAKLGAYDLCLEVEAKLEEKNSA